MEHSKKIEHIVDTSPLIVGIAGFGTVGSGLLKTLEESRETIKKRIGRDILIKKVLVRDKTRKRAVDLPHGATYCDSVDDLINDAEIDVIVELMGGTNLAYTLIFGALNAGKHVVTANKALLAERGDELFTLAAEKNLFLGYEASVCGGIPIIQTMQQGLAANNIINLAGILNGTCNYILSSMSTTGTSFANALQQAQDLGFAEADPTLDISGMDSAHKLFLLIRLAWGVKYPLDRMYIEGISKVAIEDISFAREFGYSIKLIAHACMVGGKVEAEVSPTLVPKKLLLARVGHSYNAVRVEGSSVGSIFLHGLGAGDTPTGSAVAADLLEIARGGKPNNTGFVSSHVPVCDIMEPADSFSEYYVRLTVKDVPGVMRDVAGIFASHNISIAQAIQRGLTESVPMLFTTHKAKAGEMKKAIDELRAEPFITGDCVYYRMMAKPKGVSR